MFILRFVFLLLLLCNVSVSQAFALDLQQARAQGMIAEQPDGFIRALSNSDEAAQLVREVNAARLAEYQRISQEKGQPVSVIGKIAAEEIARKIR
jgi:uncharacterized protein YdbL (DUF1318 family)